MKTPTYNSWCHMRDICNNPKNPRYTKGISYCKRWEVFSNFLRDMGERPVGLVLSRIDYKKNYSKSNCKWMTYREQQRIRREFLELGGSIAQLADDYDLPYSTLQNRLKRGWELTSALTTPRGTNKTQSTIPSQVNTSGIRGVTWDARTSRWMAQFQYRGVTLYLGRYYSLTNAAQAIESKKNQLFGNSNPKCRDLK